MEQLTADASTPPESKNTTQPHPELDRALARAIRRLIAEVSDQAEG
jgi:hypothetical protein